MRNSTELKNDMVIWTQKYFEQSGAKGAVIGISGGKDSAVVAALLVEALGKDSVVGVLMPNSVQPDLHDSLKVVEHLGIRHLQVDIGAAVAALQSTIASALETRVSQMNSIASTNLPPRVRMTTLYMVAAQLGHGFRVAGTGNASESYVGYFTKWGDGACDFNLLANLTTEEVIAVGHELGLPNDIVDKTPSDGLCGLSDEENLGFTYAELNTYIKSGSTGNPTLDSLISQKHAYSAHKRSPIVCYDKA